MCWSSTIFTNTTSRTATSLICRAKSLCSGKGSFEFCMNSTIVFIPGTGVLFEPSVSVADAVPRQFLTMSSSHHPSCHVISRNLTPAFGDKLLYMLQFWNHSVCPIFIWVRFAWIHSFITSNTHLQLSLLFLCAQLPSCHAVHHHWTSL
jgi:hypothetical protein